MRAVISLLALVLMVGCSSNHEDTVDSAITDQSSDFTAKFTTGTFQGGALASSHEPYFYVYSTASKIGGKYSDIYIYISGVPEARTYSLGEAAEGASVPAGMAWAKHTVRLEDGKRITYTTDTTHRGTLTITKYDPKRKTISGTFSFTAAAQLTGETVAVTEGNFTDASF